MVLPIYETPEDVSKASDGLSSSQSITGDDEESDVASSTKNRVEREMQSSIAKKEEEMVRVIRLLVFLAILCSAVAVSVAVYFFAAASDTSLFEIEVRERHNACPKTTYRLDLFSHHAFSSVCRVS